MSLLRNIRIHISKGVSSFPLQNKLLILKPLKNHSGNSIPKKKKKKNHRNLDTQILSKWLAALKSQPYFWAQTLRRAGCRCTSRVGAMELRARPGGNTKPSPPLSPHVRVCRARSRLNQVGRDVLVLCICQLMRRESSLLTVMPARKWCEAEDENQRLWKGKTSN